MKFIDTDKEDKKNINKLERKRKIIKKLIISLNIVNMLIAGYNLERKVSPILTPSPYDGNEIDIDLDKLDKEVIKVSKVIEQSMSEEEIIKYVENNMSMDEKKNRLLLSALYKNPYYNKNDQVQFAGYLQYLSDNPYIDYETVYKKFKSSILLKNVSLQNASGNYSSMYNIIKLDDYSSFGHEGFHLEDMYLHNYMNDKTDGYDFQDWFVEGFAEVLSSEYIDFENTTYPVECAAIRIFTEFLGSDKMLEVRSKGNFEIFVDAMVEKGVDKQELLDLLDVLNKYTKEYKRDCKNTEEIEEQKNNCDYLVHIIFEKFVSIYNEIYDTPEKVSPIFVYNLDKIINQETQYFNEFNYFLFNKRMLEKEPYPYEIITFPEAGSTEYLIVITDKSEYHQDEIYNYRNNKLQSISFYSQEEIQKFLLEENKKIK